MAKFALLLHHAPDRYANLTEDEFMGIMKDYISWVEQASADGIYAGGDKLSAARAVQITSDANGVNVHDSPMTELTEILGGVMFILATDFDAAIEIAKGHPHLVHNTKVEIRQIEGED